MLAAMSPDGGWWPLLIYADWLEERGEEEALGWHWLAAAARAPSRRVYYQQDLAPKELAWYWVNVGGLGVELEGTDGAARPWNHHMLPDEVLDLIPKARQRIGAATIGKALQVAARAAARAWATGWRPVIVIRRVWKVARMDLLTLQEQRGAIDRWLLATGWNAAAALESPEPYYIADGQWWLCEQLQQTRIDSAWHLNVLARQRAEGSDLAILKTYSASAAGGAGPA